MTTDQSPSWHLDDAAIIAAENPYTFYKPSAAAIALLRAGDHAKLIFMFESQDPQAPRAEGMWVRITFVEKNRFRGELDNDPFYIQDLKCGDPVEFEARHVIQTSVADPHPDPTAQYWPRCFVTRRVLEDGAPTGYLYREPSDGEDDSGWRITAGDETDDYMEDAANSAYVSLGAVLSKDDSFRDLLTTPAPCAFVRGATGRFESIDCASAEQARATERLRTFLLRDLETFGFTLASATCVCIVLKRIPRPRVATSDG